MSKTTLLNIMSGSDRATAGDVTVPGESLTGKDQIASQTSAVLVTPNDSINRTEAKLST